ncbi:MAG TPA: hypothetical protein VMK82_02660 [Steroidobacteraceae bacterium]|nr:hypothetical protein [Steroidobacteraceae bacterium]
MKFIDGVGVPWGKAQSSNAVHSRSDSVSRYEHYRKSAAYMGYSVSDSVATNNFFSRTAVVDRIDTTLIDDSADAENRTDSVSVRYLHEETSKPPYYLSEQNIDRSGSRSHTVGLVRGANSNWLVEMTASANLLAMGVSASALTLQARLALATISAEYVPLKVMVKYTSNLDLTIGHNFGQPTTPDGLKGGVGMVNRETPLTKLTGAHTIEITTGYRVTTSVVPKGGPVWFIGDTSRWRVGNFTNMVYGTRRTFTNQSSLNAVGGKAEFVYMGANRTIGTDFLKVADRLKTASKEYELQCMKKTEDCNVSDELIMKCKRRMASYMEDTKNAIEKTQMGSYDIETATFEAKTKIEKSNNYLVNAKMALHSNQYAIFS